jgi:LPS export ABC transporter protein LptC
LSSCSGPQEGARAPKELPTIELSESELIHYDDEGEIIWMLWARSVQYFEQETQAEGVEVRFLDEGKEVLYVRAERLIFDHRSGDLKMSGGVSVSDPEGLRLSTDEAYWDDEKRVLTSDSLVSIERDDLRLQGEGFEYHPDEGTLTIKEARLKLILRE